MCERDTDASNGNAKCGSGGSETVYESPKLKHLAGAALEIELGFL